MQLEDLARHGNDVRTLFEGLLEVDTEKALERMAAAGQWETLATLAITAAEVPARRIVTRLLAEQRFAELVLPACFRRQVRRGEVIMPRPAAARRVFRDIDAEADESGVP